MAPRWAQRGADGTEIALWSGLAWGLLAWRPTGPTQNRAVPHK